MRMQWLSFVATPAALAAGRVRPGTPGPENSEATAAAPANP